MLLFRSTYVVDNKARCIEIRVWIIATVVHRANTYDRNILFVKSNPPGKYQTDTRLVHRARRHLNLRSGRHVQKLDGESIWDIVIESRSHTVEEKGVIRLSVIN